MSDWPSTLFAPELTVVTTAGGASGVGRDVQGPAGFATAAIAWPSANLAIFCPIYLEMPFSVVSIAWENGASVTGNIDAGIYDPNGNRLVSAGSTAQAGTSTIQKVALSATALEPGTYFWGLVASSASALVRGTSAGATAAFLRICGVQQMATALPLPSTATFAAATNAFCPFIGVAGVATQ